MGHNVGFRLVLGVLLLSLGVAACGSAANESPAVEEGAAGEGAVEEEAVAGGAADGAAQLHPEVVDAVFEQADDGSWTVAVTLSSPYDSPERYADAWRVTSIGGTTMYGIRELTHDHADEQPFTRSQSGIEIPLTEKTVLVQGRDLENGWGDPKQFDLP